MSTGQQHCRDLEDEFDGYKDLCRKHGVELRAKHAFGNGEWKKHYRELLSQPAAPAPPPEAPQPATIVNFTWEDAYDGLCESETYSELTEKHRHKIVLSWDDMHEFGKAFFKQGFESAEGSTFTPAPEPKGEAEPRPGPAHAEIPLPDGTVQVYNFKGKDDAALVSLLREAADTLARSFDLPPHDTYPAEREGEARPQATGREWVLKRAASYPPCAWEGPDVAENERVRVREILPATAQAPSLPTAGDPYRPLFIEDDEDDLGGRVHAMRDLVLAWNAWQSPAAEFGALPGLYAKVKAAATELLAIFNGATPQAGPMGSQPSGAVDLAVYLEFEKAYTPHKAELREAMAEWVKHRTPNELIIHIKRGIQPTTMAAPNILSGERSGPSKSIHDPGNMHAKGANPIHDGGEPATGTGASDLPLNISIASKFLGVPVDVKVYTASLLTPTGIAALFRELANHQDGGTGGTGDDLRGAVEKYRRKAVGDYETAKTGASSSYYMGEINAYKEVLAILNSGPDGGAPPKTGAVGIDYAALYADLLGAVENKYPLERRHDTAKRLIFKAQAGAAAPSQAGPERLTPEEVEANRVLARKQFEQLKGPAMVTCPCDRTIPVRFAYRCLFCGVFHCEACAEVHFGKTRAEYSAERHPKMVKARNEEADGIICQCGHRHDLHHPIQSVNYTAGKCKECACLHFIIAADPEGVPGAGEGT